MKTIKANDVSIQHLSVLLIGDPGSGKSHFIAAMPKPLLVLNFDGKAAITYSRAPGAKDIDIMQFDPTDPEAVLDLDNTLDELVASTLGDYATVALDSLTTYGQAEMRRAVYVNSTGGKGGTRIGNVVPNQTDYLLQMVRIELVLQRLISLPCHVAVASHEATIVDKNGGFIATVAHVSGKNTLAKHLPAKFSESYHTEQIEDTETKSTTYRIRCRGNETYSWCFSKIGTPDFITNGWTEVEACLRGGA